MRGIYFHVHLKKKMKHQGLQRILFLYISTCRHFVLRIYARKTNFVIETVPSTLKKTRMITITIKSAQGNKRRPAGVGVVALQVLINTVELTNSCDIGDT